jgi:hypothetical protein
MKNRLFCLVSEIGSAATFIKSRGLPLNGHTRRASILALIFSLALTESADGATATFSTTAPAIGPNDISNLTGHVTSGSEANQQKSNVGGALGNDTYLADDQMIQGQTFRTGTTTNGYQLTAVTIRAVTYSTFSLIPDINYTIRITSPSGSTLTVLAEETAFVPFDAPDNIPTISGGNNKGAGSGTYVTFTLDSPVVLNPNTTYGFDVGGGSVRHYWETDGRSCTPSGPNCNPIDPYSNGTAYSSGANGSGNTTLTNRSGDRVFVVALTPANVILPPKISLQPKSLAFYAGRTAQFNAKASGSPALVYQWKRNNTNINNGGNISGALTDSLTISNVTAADAGNYSLMVTNPAGATNSAAASLTVVPAPVAGFNYVYAIYTNNALAHFRLNERGDPATNPPAYDYIGGRIGSYESVSQNGFNGIAGPRPAAFPGFESTNTALQTAGGTDLAWVTVPGLNVNTNTVTITAWIYPNGVQSPDAGLFWTRSGGTTAGIGYNATGQLNYTWNGAHYDFASGLVIPSDQWSFVAVVIEPTRALLYLGTAGSLSNSINSPVIHTSEGWSGSSRIGSDPHGSSPARNFNGIIDEVAVFKRALSFNEINTFFGIGRGVVQAVLPSISKQPGSQTLYSGGTAKFTTTVSGSLPLTYQWRKNGANLSDGGNISGSLTDSLTIANVSAGDIGNYTLVVTNSAGGVTSAPPAALTVVAPSGKPYEAAVRAANPIAYWRLNESGDPSSDTLAAFNYLGGLNGTYRPGSLPGVTGLQPLDFPGLESTNTAVQTTANGSTPSWVTLPPLNLNTNTVTFTAWIFPNTIHGAYNGLLTTRNGTTPAAGFHFTSDNQIGYTWNGGNSETWSFLSELRPPVGQWSFAALVIDPTNAALYLYNTTSMSTTNNAIPHTSEAWDGNAQLGGDQELANWRIFDGTIDELAIFNYAFTPAQILNLYNSALGIVPPSVTLNIARVGANLQLTWPQGTLLEASNVNGPYTTNNNASPYTFAPTGTQKYFRVKVQ